MSKIINIIENTSVKRQLLYGTILAAFFLSITWLGGVHSFIAVGAIAIISVAKEHYMEDITGEFNYRNLLLLLLPVFLAYFIIHW